MISLGNLGPPMALRLAEAGWTVDVLDRRRAVAPECEAAGPTVARQPLDLADCTVVAIVVPYDQVRPELFEAIATNLGT